MNYLKSFIASPNSTKPSKLLIQGTIDKDENETSYSRSRKGDTIDTTPVTFSFSDTPEDSPALEPKKVEESEYYFADYKVEKHDTLYNIALTYHLDPETLGADNNLETDTLEPGQRIKIRIPAKPKECRVKNKIVNKDEILFNPAEESAMGHREYKRKTLKELRVKAERVALDHWNVYYCTSFGDAEGSLSIGNTALTFKPEMIPRSMGSLEDASEIERKIKHLEVSIDIQDIAECNMMAVPSLLCEEHYNTNREFEKDYLIQVILYTHGDRSLGKYLDGLFNDLKEKKTPYACVYFKLKNITENMQEYTNEQKQHMLQEIKAKVMEAKHARQQHPAPKVATKLPHFEFLYEKFDKKDGDLLRKLVKNSLWADTDFVNALGAARKISTSSVEEEMKMGDISPARVISSTKRRIIPKITKPSNILSLQQFTELINCVPELYMMLEWDLVYSNITHGTSFTNLLRKAENATPFILVVQDDQRFVFGVYGSEKLRYSNDYYGNGETFLFTFRDLEEITIYTWSKTNNRLFIFTSEQGLTFGAAPHYGLWVNNELTHGRSFPCETFNNAQLSHSPDFNIARIELWTIKDPTYS